MLSRGRVAGFAWGFLAVAAVAGCATQRGAVAPVAMEQNSSSDTAAIAGVWEGEVWEMPSHYIQGVRRGRRRAPEPSVHREPRRSTAAGRARRNADGLGLLHAVLARVEGRAHEGRVRHLVQGA